MTTKHKVTQQVNFLKMRRVYTGQFLLMAALLVAGCNKIEVPKVLPTAAFSAIKTPDTPIANPTLSPPTAVPPTSTPSEPMAALVNGKPIFLSAYERELARYEQAQGELGLSPDSSDADYRQLVLDVLIERELIAQAAARQGLTIAPDAVDIKLAELEGAAGDVGNFTAWLEANQWSREEFHSALAAEMLTEAMVTAVTADVPTAVEQVNARYLQVDDLGLAESLLQQIHNGSDFSTLARQHSLDRITAENGGDIGYFARGSLLVKSVEDAAFALEPGEISEIITTSNGDGIPAYYLVQLIERDTQRPLSADMRYTMLQQSFESWLAVLWQEADIARLIDT